MVLVVLIFNSVVSLIIFLVQLCAHESIILSVVTDADHLQPPEVTTWYSVGRTIGPPVLGRTLGGIVIIWN